jgi:hypothetical protein
VLARQRIHRHEANVVASVAILRTDVAKSYNQIFHNVETFFLKKESADSTEKICDNLRLTILLK